MATLYEKTVWAEFNTPKELTQTMLAQIPSSFWKTPKRIWEPCCGKGSFVLSCFNKLMEGLEENYPILEERYRIIIEECIYFSDINPDNVEYCKTQLLSILTIPLNKSFHFNCFTGDILQEYPYPTHFFDLIVGNPPFNASTIIWPKMVQNALTIWIKPEGLFLFIVPPGWRKPDKERSKFHGLFSLLTKQNHLLYLEMHNKKDGRTLFKCNTFFDWFLVQKRENNNLLSCIVDVQQQSHKLNMLEMTWLPNLYIDELLILSTNHFQGNEKVKLIYSRCAYGTDKKHMSLIKDDIYIYPCIHSTLKNETKYYYSTRNDRGHFGQSKVIFGESGIYNPILDWEGKYGLTHCAMAIQIDSIEEGNQLCIALVSPKFQSLIKACICSSFRIDWTIFTQFRKDFYLYL
jgi:hypothetical protein